MSVDRSTQTGGSTAPSKTSKSAPHVHQSSRDALDDRGLVFDDNTEELRKPPALQAEGFPNQTQLSRKTSS